MKKQHGALLLTPLDTSALERMGPFPFAAPAPLVPINHSPVSMPLNAY